MKNKLIISLCGFWLLLFVQNNHAQNVFDEEKGKAVLKFSQHKTFSEVEEILYQYDLVPEELNFEIESSYGETIYGGYTVDGSITFEYALVDLKQKHENFLREGITSLIADINNQKERSVRVGLMNLKNQFSQVLAEYEVKGLRLNSITVSDSFSARGIPKDDRFEKIELINSFAKNVKSFDVLANVNTAARETWSPNRGSTKVNKSMSFQTFYFNNISGFGSNSTYEHEAQVYDTAFANYDNYYSTNLPNGYKDTQFLDGDIDNFTVGTSRACLLKTNTQYFTNMALRGQTAQTANVKIKGQIGHRTPSWCYSLWCVVGDATTPSLKSFTAPINNQINW